MDIYLLSQLAHQEAFSNLLESLLESQEANRKKTLSRISEIIFHIAQYGGHPMPPHAKPLRECDGEINELRPKYIDDQLLRIYYFVDRDANGMFLMNYIIKPESYEKKQKKKVDSDIKQSIIIAQELMKLYSSHPHLYEPLR